jgi:hypothetical protein
MSMCLEHAVWISLSKLPVELLSNIFLIKKNTAMIKIKLILLNEELIMQN